MLRFSRQLSAAAGGQPCLQRSALRPSFPIIPSSITLQSLSRWNSGASTSTHSISSAAGPQVATPAAAAGGTRSSKKESRHLLRTALSLLGLLFGAHVFTAVKPLYHDMEELRKTDGAADLPRDGASELQWNLWRLRVSSERFIRDGWVAVAIISDYLRHKDQEDWTDIHQRGADWLVRLCLINKGVYLKLGQMVSTLSYLLPDEYVDAMAPLTHKCPVDPFPTVQEIVEKELGRPLHELFSSFNEKPIASASLAQVHVATDRLTGRKLAVKVQHAGLKETSEADIRVVTALVRIVKALFPRFDYDWLAAEIEANLPIELNFIKEAEQCEAAGKAFAHREDVVVPAIYRQLSSRRVLAMSFEEGCYAVDVPSIQQMGLSCKDVAALVAECFSEQIYLQGCVHADPHAANMLVRPMRPGSKKPQLVLLDHGLYRKLDRQLRLSYAKMWRAIIYNDVEGIKKYAERMNAHGLHQLFASMLTAKTWDEMQAAAGDTEKLKLKGTKEERKETAANAKGYAKEIQEVLRRVPRDLLLVLKTNECLRSVDSSLGAPVNNFLISARYIDRALKEERLRAHPGLWTRVTATWESWKLQSRMLGFSLMLGIWDTVGWLFGGAAGGKKEVTSVSPATAAVSTSESSVSSSTGAPTQPVAAASVESTPTTSTAVVVMGGASK